MGLKDRGGRTQASALSPHNGAFRRKGIEQANAAYVTFRRRINLAVRVSWRGGW